MIESWTVPPESDLIKNPYLFGRKEVSFLPNQFEMCFAPEYAIAEVDAVGTGKTQGAIMRATRLSAWYPGNMGLIGRYAATDLAATTQADCLEFWRDANLLEDFVQRGEYKIPTAVIRCVNPRTNEILPGKFSEALFIHLDDPDHARGHKVGWVWGDECSEYGRKAYDILMSRIRRPGFQKHYSMFFTGNTAGHNFWYQHFFDPEAMARLKTKKPDAWAKRRAISTTTYKNRFLAPEYIQNMEDNYSEEVRKVMMEGSFDVFEGQLWPEWSEPIHTFRMRDLFPNGIPASWDRYLAVDPGGSDPWAWEFAAVDPHGNIIFYDEIYRPGTLIDSFALEALPKITPFRFKSKVIDYQNKVVAGELGLRGISFTNAQKMNKADSVFRFAGYLHPNPSHAFPEWHPNAGKPNSPRLFVAKDKCPKLCMEIPQQRWRQKRSSLAEGFENEIDPTTSNHSTDACLSPETLVTTDKGVFPIKSLVGTTGKILSHLGWEPYDHCRLTRRDTEIVRVHFDDGTKVECTPDHRFLTENGWIQAAFLSDAMVYSLCDNTSCTSQPTQTDLRNFRGIPIVSTGEQSISPGATNGFIALYGNGSTGLFQRPATSITETTIATTMSRKILSACRERNISAITHLRLKPLSGIGEISKSQDRSRQSGMEAKPVETGTKSTGRDLSARNSKHGSPNSVNGASRHLKSPCSWTATPSYVLCDAIPQNGRRPGSMTKIEYADIAGQDSDAIGMQRNASVPRNAFPDGPIPSAVLNKCVKVESAGRSDVYCLSVEGSNAFSIQGGIVVHNCLYLLRERPRPTELEKTLISAAEFAELDKMSVMMWQLKRQAKLNEGIRRLNNLLGHGGRFGGKMQRLAG